VKKWRALAVALALAATTVSADVVHLTNGDRISGKIVTAGRKSYVLQTPYGRLNLPRVRIWKVEKPDGSEEVLNSPDAAAVPTARIILVVMGSQFWQAWDPKDAAGVDPSLRLEVRLDEEPIASYVDARQDPDELPKAVMNAFSFNPGDLALEPAAGVTVPLPEAKPGRVVLKIDVPVPPAGPHRLRVSYQTNGGTGAEPSWKDIVTAESQVTLKEGVPVFMALKQDGGKMDFGGFPRKKMKLVETFKVTLEPDTAP
jgi:hypothetical protein